MSIYINFKDYGDLKAEGTSPVFQASSDVNGQRKYVSQHHMPPTYFTYSNFGSKYEASSVTGTVQASGTYHATPIYLPGNFLVSNLSVVMGTTTSSALDHRAFGLADSGLIVRTFSADDTTAVPTVSTIATLPIAKTAGATATTYTTPSTASTAGYEGAPSLFYFLNMMHGSTIGSYANQQAALYSVTTVPKNGVTDQTSKTAPLTTDGTVTVSIATPAITVPWVGVS